MTREAEIEARLAKAEKGEWRVIFKHHRAYEIEIDGSTAFLIPARYSEEEKVVDEANAILVIYAPDDLRYLLGRVEKLEKAGKEILRRLDDSVVNDGGRFIIHSGDVKAIDTLRAALEREGGA